MKKEIIKIKLIDKSRVIDSLNGYRIILKDNRIGSYLGYDIIKRGNGAYEAHLNGKFAVSGGTKSEVRKEIDLIEKEKEKSDAPLYLIIIKSRWVKYKKRAYPEAVERNLDNALLTKNSLERTDGIPLVIINNKTWEKVG